MSIDQQLPRRTESGMHTRSVNAAAGVLLAAMEQGRQTPTGLAIALDSARLLNSPEHAAEFQRLREQAAATPADVDDEPASDLLLAELARNVRAVGRFDEPQWEDPYWCEHIAFLGKYTGQLLRRLLDAEARVGELEAGPRLSADEVAGWLLKKAREYPSAPERQESVPDAIARLASKVTRGAIRSNNTAGAPSLPWAHTMSDDDLHGFLGDLLSAAIGRWQHSPEVPDRKVLAAVELACANWRTPGEGYRSDDPDGDE